MEPEPQENQRTISRLYQKYEGVYPVPQSRQGSQSNLIVSFSNLQSPAL